MKKRKKQVVRNGRIRARRTQQFNPFNIRIKALSDRMLGKGIYEVFSQQVLEWFFKVKVLEVVREINQVA